MAIKRPGLNTMIGPGAAMEGDFSFAGFTRIDGKLRGDVESLGDIVIGEEARLSGNMFCESVTVGGVVRGDVFASNVLSVLSTGVVFGDCVASSIKAEEGCIIHGRITICRTKEMWDEAAAVYRDKKALKRQPLV